MPQSMRVNVWNTGALGRRGKQLIEAIACKWPALRHEHPFITCTLAVKGAEPSQIIAIKGLARVLAALKPRDRYIRAVEVDIRPPQLNKLRDAQAMVPRQANHQPIPQ